MKAILSLALLLLGISSLAAQINERDKLKSVAEMRSSLAHGGIDQFVEEAQRNSWMTPSIPSQWHVEHVSKPEQKQLDIAARELGEALAAQLDGMGKKMQGLPSGDSLYEEPIRLLDLSEWCAATEGYGNVFLAQRCLDLAAVGIARLAANLDFPTEKLTPLVGRMRPAWMNAEANRRILNQDAGAPIFGTSDRDEMERTYSSGYRLLQEQNNPSLFVERQKNAGAWRLIDNQVIRANLLFFDHPEAAQLRPDTLLHTWGMSKHLSIIVGLELQSVSKAEALAEFRRAIGKFPDKPTFTAEQIRRSEKETTEAAKKGIKIVPFEAAYPSPMAAAFAQAWKNYLESNGVNAATLPPQRYNLDTSAFEAYDEVKRGAFLDMDSQESEH